MTRANEVARPLGAKHVYSPTSLAFISLIVSTLPSTVTVLGSFPPFFLHTTMPVGSSATVQVSTTEEPSETNCVVEPPLITGGSVESLPLEGVWNFF